MLKIKIGNKIFSDRMILFILLVIAYSFIGSANETTGDGIFSVSSLSKYGILLLSVLSEIIYFYRSKTSVNKVYLKREFKNFLWYFIILITLTIFMAVSSMRFSVRSMQTFIFVFLPMLYAFLVINTWTLEQIDICLKIGFIISFIGYILSTHLSITYILHALNTINYEDTNSSLLESSTFALLALGFSGYLCYFNKGWGWKLFSVVFVIMTFKRQITLTAIVLLVLGLFKVKNKKLNILLTLGLTILLVVFAFYYYHAIQPNNILDYSQKLGVDLREFSTNRTDRLNWLENSTYQSYGFGSSIDYMYKEFGGFALEMDVVQLFVELGPLAVISFFVSYLRFSRENAYVFSFMYLILINSILSSGMASTFAWVIILIGMSAILKKSQMMEVNL